MKFLSKMKSMMKITINKPLYIKRTKQIDFQENNIYLINTPEHSNLGDHMIAKVSIEFLKENFNDYNIVEITHDHYKYAKKYILSKIKANSLIIIHGGGYLGDLWENEQKLFCDIVESFPKNKIVAFPQTIFFKDTSKIEYYKQRFKEYDNLTILAREIHSYDFIVENDFINNNNILLTPDIVLYYPVKSYHQKREGILVCLRNDKEQNLLRKDIQNLLNYLETKIDYTDMISDHNIKINARNIVLDRKLLEFSRHELVITDRLHAMVFAYLTRTPCIAFDNISRKVSGVYEWIKESNYIKCYTKYNEKEVLEDINNLLNIHEKSFQNCKEHFNVLKEELNDILYNLNNKNVDI